MKLYNVLLFEDELPLARIVTDSLEKRGFNITHAGNGQEGMQLFHQQDFDICIVDVMMPKADGFTFVREIRKTNQQVPIIFLTAKAKPEDVIKGFACGGNDYLKKPFSLEELILRLKELLRRTAPETKFVSENITTYTIGLFTFDALKQELWLGNTLAAKLSHRENELLLLFIQQRNQIIDRKYILIKIWGDDNFFNARSMDVFVTKLRKYLKPDPAVEIINIRGFGYKLLADG